MNISITVNGKKLNKSDLKSVTIKNDIVCGLIQKAAKRQRDKAEVKKPKTA